MAPDAPAESSRRPRLTPAMADARRAVRASLTDLTLAASGAAPGSGSSPIVLVALSGGPDSLALAAATAFEAPRLGLRAGAAIIDHGLQDGSAEVAAAAAEAARALGLDPVVVRRVDVGTAGGPEAAARDARYAALEAIAAETAASTVLLGHTLDDQAETVLLGLARGSGPTSLAGMPAASGVYRRPLLGLRRASLAAACAGQGLTPWHDPHNDDPSYTRVRVRQRVLPVLETELDAGVVEALARTAELVREDAEALDRMVDEQLEEELIELAEAGCSLPASWLVANPAALRHRLIRRVALAEFGASLSRAQTLEVARLVTEWHGQGAVHLPGIRVERVAGRIVFTAVS